MGSDSVSDMNGSPLTNGRFSNRAARFYWADDEPSPQRAYSVQQVSKVSSSDSHFEESPLVIASISAGVIGVAIIIIILVGIWIRSRLFSEEGRSGGSDNPNNTSVRSSMSTLEEETYTVCMEMDATVLGSMRNVLDRPANSSKHLDVADDCCELNSPAKDVPCTASTEEALDIPSTPAIISNENTTIVLDADVALQEVVAQ